MEIWKPVEGYCDLYEVSNLGKILYKPTGKAKSTRIDKWGYEYVTLSIGGKCKERFVHRLVAAAFHANPYNKPEVNHIDSDKLNNASDNLEWVTSEENERHAIESGLITAGKPVVGTHKTTHEVFVFESINEASRATGECRSGIASAVNGRQRGTANFLWGAHTPKPKPTFNL